MYQIENGKYGAKRKWNQNKFCVIYSVCVRAYIAIIWWIN